MDLTIGTPVVDPCDTYKAKSPKPTAWSESVTQPRSLRRTGYSVLDLGVLEFDLFPYN